MIERKQIIFDRCAVCGEPIIASDGFYDGDYYIETIQGYIHFDCVMEWAYQNRREAK